MDVVRKSQPALDVPAVGAAPKLTIEKFADGDLACLKFAGTIDESFEGKKLGRGVHARTLVLDLGGVKKISSFGIREWVDFISAASAQTKELVLIECAPKVIDQLNMVANFAGAGRVFSFHAPFRCDYCDSEHRVLLDVARDLEAIKAMKLADRPCPSCGESMYFDDDGSTYFSFVLGQGSFELAPDVAQFLAAKLDYRAGRIDQKVRVDKVIEGRLTYLRLAGDLDATFPRDKLAEGLEGPVIVDLGSVPRLEPAGAAEWRAFVQQVTPLVEQLYLVGVHAPLVEKLCGREDLGGKGIVVECVLPYACATCGTTSAQPIDVAEHHEVLRSAAAPALRCMSCKTAMQCTASEQAMAVLPGLPRPQLGKELQRQIGMLRARRLDRKPSTGFVAVPEAPGGGPRSWLVPALLAAVLVVGAAAGIVYYVKSMRAADPGLYGAGPIAARSASPRPAWIGAAATPGAATCTEHEGALSCVGVSMLSASQEDAEDEASDAASDAIVTELGSRISDPTWQAAVPPLYLPAREAKLAALARDAQSTQARREVREARRAVARALRGIEVTAAGRYWEAFDGREGRRYVAFAQIRLAVGDVERLIASYAQPHDALGAVALPYFPGLAWRFPRLAHGAVIARLEPGAIQELGIAEHYIVLAVGGREVTDAESFARIVREERALLAERGGALRLLVQTSSGDPREFSTTIAGKATERPRPGTHGGRPSGTDGSTGGGINVWDRFSGNRGSGRDDPTQ